MKKTGIALMAMMISGLMIIPIIQAEYSNDTIDKLRVSKEDLPNGFIYGKIPPFAKKVIKDNPWMLDRAAVKRLTKEIYPGGDYSKVSNIHVTIIANKEKPYRDDLVCYIIRYNDSIAAKDELKKLNNYIKYNSDRAIVITRDNLAIYYHCDRTSNMRYLKDIASKTEKRLKNM